MKKIIYSALWVALLAVSQMSCKPVDNSTDPNVIVDEKGVKIELSWSNTAANPAEKTDLDLSLIEKTSSKEVLSSSNWAKYESIELLVNTVSNGNYDLGVYISNVERQSNYKITVTGLLSGKQWSKSYGPIYANDRYSTLKPSVLTVSKTKFSVN
jgi:hypothetical protein